MLEYLLENRREIGAILFIVIAAWYLYGPARHELMTGTIMNAEEALRKHIQAEAKRYKHVSVPKKGKNFKGEYGRRTAAAQKKKKK